jgi:hypothetical protein
VSAKRTDDPKAVGLRLGAQARAALAALEAKLNENAARPVTKGEIVERAILLLARRERARAG